MNQTSPTRKKTGEGASALPPPSVLRRMSDSALLWYRAHGRDLPWRRTHDPYAILVSELMLQQTTVSVVEEYYERFLRRFPDVRSLAAAGEEDVLAQWAGLGYYRRARLLQSAAREIVDNHGGRFPCDVEALQRLPGVGRYTAGAIASFAFDLPAPIVEANTARLYARLFAVEGQLGAPAVVRRLWDCATSLLPPSGGREHNSALMDIGALVCTPVRPRCGECPLKRWCAAERLGLTASIPAPKARVEKLVRAFAGAVIQCGSRYLVRRIPPGEWHAGMYEFPKVPVEAGGEADQEEQALRDFLSGLCTLEGPLARFAELRYVVTRHAVTLTVWRGQARLPAEPAPARSREKQLPAADFQWLTLAEIETLPLGSAQRRLLRLLSGPDDFFGNGHA